jgi:pyruvate/2-oxoglutarate dehydrogenase complex dihydrolipoamide dehydrogenase (E3) component
MMKRPLDSLVWRVRNSNIDLRLSKEVTVKEIRDERPDVVILATGAKPINLSLPGLENPLTGEEVLTGRRRPGRRVLVIGGGMVGLEAAEFLAEREHQITVVELLEEVARDMLPITRKLTLKQLAASGVEVLTGVEVARLEGQRTFIAKDGREQLLGDFDSVVVAVGTRSVNDLEPLLRKEGVAVRVIGDAKKPRQIFDAVKEGHETAAEV